jgi:beta-lactamase regulating signal transducer with metallopeptidase domain
VEPLLCIALSNAVAATLMAVAVAAVGRLCRRPAVLHALWLLVLLKLLTPPLVPLPLAWLPAPDNSSPVVESHPPAEPNEPIVPLAATTEEPIAPASEPAPPRLTLGAFWKPAGMLFWLCGSLAWWMIAGARLVRFHRLLRQARRAPEVVQEQGRRLAALLGVRRCPPILFVSAPLSPMLWALGFSPRLLIPADLWQRLSREQQDTLLAHELAHLRRGDHWIRRLEFLVLGLYWWHPVVWWAQRRLQEAEEECCDGRVVAVLPDAASAYASALVETVTFLAQTRAVARIGASGAGQVPVLKRRLTMILTATPSGRPSRAGFWAVLGLGALLLPLAPGAAQTERPDGPVPLSGENSHERTATIRPEVKRRLDEMPLVISKRQGLVAESCLSCHESHSWKHGLLWHDKSEAWRGIHDEMVRYMDQLAELKRSGERGRGGDERERAEQVEKLQDEIELLKVEARLKEIHLQAAKGALAAANRRLQGMSEQNRRQPGSVPGEEVRSAQFAVEKEEFDVRIKEAELQKSLVHLKQAERRLTRLQPPKDRPPAAGGEVQARKLRELESKVESLLKEIHNLRRETRPKE